VLKGFADLVLLEFLARKMIGHASSPQG